MKHSLRSNFHVMNMKWSGLLLLLSISPGTLAWRQSEMTKQDLGVTGTRCVARRFTMLGFSRRLFLRVSCFLCLLSIYALIPAYMARNVVFAQDRSGTTPRTVQLAPSLPQDPAKIVKVMLAGVEVKPGLPTSLACLSRLTMSGSTILRSY